MAPLDASVAPLPFTPPPPPPVVPCYPSMAWLLMKPPPAAPVEEETPSPPTLPESSNKAPVEHPAPCFLAPFHRLTSWGLPYLDPSPADLVAPQNHPPLPLLSLHSMLPSARCVAFFAVLLLGLLVSGVLTPVVLDPSAESESWGTAAASASPSSFSSYSSAFSSCSAY
ncbi:hypothetical protein MUK42_25983 [Musa troglodytarum]|uniref:Uncharacterized protein n=1 Tax=Musa troglodytarum TaxID=320322 RepID=A0A9E7EEH8_9LILI|nr:hypothetical protein MUK42_25983 [Musa troglodytarum]